MSCRSMCVVSVVFMAFTIGNVIRGQDVSQLADPDKIVFRGVHAYTPTEIARGLRRDNELISAAATARVSDYLELLRQHLIAGFAYDGFVQVQVSVAVDKSAAPFIAVDIDEGPRFSYGEIRVTGVPDDIAGLIRQRLMKDARNDAEDLRKVTHGEADFICWQRGDSSASVTLDEEKPLWRPGHILHSTAERTKSIEQRLQRTLADEGYPTARFHTLVEFEGQTAHLRVAVKDLGVRSKVSEIYVEGNRRDTDEEVIRFLGLTRDEAWTAQCKQRILNRLWESASFSEYSVTSDIVDGRARVFVYVAEWAKGTPLTAGPSREDAALLKLRDWIENREGRSRDLVVQYASDRLEGTLVISRRNGVLLEFALGAPDARHTERHAVVLTQTDVGVCAAQQRARFSWTNNLLEMMPTVDLSVAQDDTTAKTRTLQLNMSASLADPAIRPPSISVKLNAPPLYFCSLAHHKQARVEWHGDELAISQPGTTFRVNARTGELMECELTNNDGEPVRTTLRFEADAFRTRREELETTSRDCQAYPDPARPLNSTVEFFCLWYSQLLQGPFNPAGTESAQRLLEAVALVDKLAKSGFLTPLERHWPVLDVGAEERFCVPLTNRPIPKDWKAYFAMEARDYSDSVFAANTWPAMAWQEGWSLWGGVSDRSRSDIPELCRSGGFGPLACCTVATLLRHDSSFAEHVAAIGMQQLDKESFLRDCTVLLTTKLQAIEGTDPLMSTPFPLPPKIR